MEVPRSTVTWTRELERRQTARQAEPGGSEEMWGGGVSIFTRKFEDGNRSLFFGGAFVQCDDIPLIMAGGKI